MKLTWEAIAAFVSAGILLITLAIILWQIREMKRGRNAQLAASLYQQIIAISQTCLFK